MKQSCILDSVKRESGWLRNVKCTGEHVEKSKFVVIQYVLIIWFWNTFVCERWGCGKEGRREIEVFPSLSSLIHSQPISYIIQVLSITVSHNSHGLLFFFFVCVLIWSSCFLGYLCCHLITMVSEVFTWMMTWCVGGGEIIPLLSTSC